MGGRDLFFVVMLCRSSGVLSLMRVWVHPESQNTLVVLLSSEKKLKAFVLF